MNFFKDNREGKEPSSQKGQGQSQGQSSNNDLMSNKDNKARDITSLPFAARKGEKLTTALYMVTDIMTEREPLKWKMREVAIDLLSDLTHAVDAPIEESITLLTDVIRKIEKEVSYLDIGRISRMISDMNASVLKREYIQLKRTIEYEWENIFSQNKSIFSESFFDVDETQSSFTPRVGSPALEEAIERAPVQKDKRKDVEQVRPSVRLGGNTPNAETHREKSFMHKDPMNVLSNLNPKVEIHPERLITVALPEVTPARIKLQGALSDTEPLPRKNESGVEKGDRRTIILALIKQKPALAVKDISKSIPGVSEKTIQRELLAMVAEGVLVKRGERRWSTYSLSS